MFWRSMALSNWGSKIRQLKFYLIITPAKVLLEMFEGVRVGGFRV